MAAQSKAQHLHFHGLSISANATYFSNDFLFPYYAPSNELSTTHPIYTLPFKPMPSIELSYSIPVYNAWSISLDGFWQPVAMQVEFPETFYFKDGTSMPFTLKSFQLNSQGFGVASGINYSPWLIKGKNRFYMGFGIEFRMNWLSNVNYSYSYRNSSNYQREYEIDQSFSTLCINFPLVWKLDRSNSLAFIPAFGFLGQQSLFLSENFWMFGNIPFNQKTFSYSISAGLRYTHLLEFKY